MALPQYLSLKVVARGRARMRAWRLGLTAWSPSAWALPHSARGWKPCRPDCWRRAVLAIRPLPHSPWFDHLGGGGVRHLSLPVRRNGRLGNSGDGQKLKQAIREAAAIQFGCGAEAVVLADGRATASDGRSLSFGEVAAKARSAIAVEATFSNTKRTYSYGAHAAHVAVDDRTGRVEVLDYVAVEDVGRAINPAIVHGQALGALVQGLGGVFLDHLIYDEDAQLLNASLADYLVPTATDFPNVRGVTLELRPSPSNPLGAKGAGEGGIVAVAATIANAIANALSPLGVEPKALPLTPPVLWRLIQEARQR